MSKKSLYQALRAVEYALAEAHYLATVNSPFEVEAAEIYLIALRRVEQELADLSSFVRKQVL